jgi:hypothetical protein
MNEELPTVTLGERSWPLPRLAIKQLRRVRHKIISLTRDMQADPDETTGDKIMNLTDEQYDDMLDAVYWSLTRAEPMLSREDFDNLQASDTEILLAFFAVRAQSGLYVTAAAGSEQPGEATA